MFKSLNQSLCEPLIHKKQKNCTSKPAIFASESFPCGLIEQSLKPTSLRDKPISKYHNTF